MIRKFLKEPLNSIFAICFSTSYNHRNPCIFRHPPLNNSAITNYFYMKYIPASNLLFAVCPNQPAWFSKHLQYNVCHCPLTVHSHFTINFYHNIWLYDISVTVNDRTIVVNDTSIISCLETCSFCMKPVSLLLSSLAHHSSWLPSLKFVVGSIEKILHMCC